MAMTVISRSRNSLRVAWVAIPLCVVLFGCPDPNGPMRRTWGINLPVRLQDADRPPDECLERMLRRRYAEVRRTKDSTYPPAFYVRSPVPYGGKEAWMVTGFSKVRGQALLQFGDDWFGTPLDATAVDALGRDLHDAIDRISAECGIQVLPGITCESFPDKSPCPTPY
jgi:hypothetical protein